MAVCSLIITACRVYIRHQLTTEPEGVHYPHSTHSSQHTVCAFLQTYLKHYHYLKCNSGASDVTTTTAAAPGERRRRSLADLNLSEGAEATPVTRDDGCSTSDIVTAVKIFQEASGLEASGVIDAATKQVMNRPRCGDPDDYIAEVEAHKLNGDVFDPSHNYYARPWRNNRNNDDVFDDAANVQGEEISLGDPQLPPKSKNRRRRRRSSRLQRRTRSSSHNIPTPIVDASATAAAAADGSRKIPRTQPPLEVYEDAHGSQFGHRPGQIHLRHHFPVPEGRLAGFDTVQTRLLSHSRPAVTSSSSSPHHQRRTLYERGGERFLRHRNINDTTSNRRASSPSSLPPSSLSSDGDARTLEHDSSSESTAAVGFGGVARHLRRRKRDDSSTSGSGGTVFTKRLLTYAFEEGGFTQSHSLSEQCEAVSLAFRLWAEVTNIDFQPAAAGANNVDVLFAFHGEYLQVPVSTLKYLASTGIQTRFLCMLEVTGLRGGVKE